LYIPECLYLEKLKASIPEWKNPNGYNQRPKSELLDRNHWVPKCEQ